MVAEPLEDGVARDIETGAVKIKDPVRQIAKFFQEKHQWISWPRGAYGLSAPTIWARTSCRTTPCLARCVWRFLRHLGQNLSKRGC